MDSCVLEQEHVGTTFPHCFSTILTKKYLGVSYSITNTISVSKLENLQLQYIIGWRRTTNWSYFQNSKKHIWAVFVIIVQTYKNNLY